MIGRSILKPWYLRSRLICALWFVTIFTMACPAWAEDNIRFVYSLSWGPPFGMVDPDQREFSGILPDISRTIAMDLGKQAKFVAIPRKRIDEFAAAGEIDVRCYAHALWVGNPELYFWSKPIFQNVDQLVVRRPKSVPKVIEDFLVAGGKPHVVGAVLGYRYPTLDNYFAQGRLLRKDMPDSFSLIGGLAAGAYDNVVVSSITLDYILGRRPSWRPLVNPERLTVETTEPACGLLKSSNLDHAAFLASVEKLANQGLFKQIIEGYLQESQ